MEKGISLKDQVWANWKNFEKDFWKPSKCDFLENEKFEPAKKFKGFKEWGWNFQCSIVSFQKKIVNTNFKVIS